MLDITTTIVGPPGSGKTTTSVQYFDKNQRVLAIAKTHGAQIRLKSVLEQS